MHATACSSCGTTARARLPEAMGSLASSRIQGASRPIPLIKHSRKKAGFRGRVRATSESARNELRSAPRLALCGSPLGAHECASDKSSEPGRLGLRPSEYTPLFAREYWVSARDTRATHAGGRPPPLRRLRAGPSCPGPAPRRGCRSPPHRFPGFRACRDPPGATTDCRGVCQGDERHEKRQRPDEGSAHAHSAATGLTRPIRAHVRGEVLLPVTEFATPEGAFAIFLGTGGIGGANMEWVATDQG